MMTIQLDMYQACALGALVYCLGRFMVKKLGFLSKYLSLIHISEPTRH